MSVVCRVCVVVLSPTLCSSLAKMPSNVNIATTHDVVEEGLTSTEDCYSNSHLVKKTSNLTNRRDFKSFITIEKWREACLALWMNHSSIGISSSFGLQYVQPNPRPLPKIENRANTALG